MTYSKIKGIGSYLPETIMTNADLEKIVDTSDEWIMKRVGVRERHLVAQSSDTTASMAAEAAKRALESANITANDVEMIVVGTASADYNFPSAACVVQQKLGIDNECPAFDLNAACAGFIYALSVVDQYIRNGIVKTALVIGVDALSKVVDWKDRTTCVLFGDGAGAVVLQADESPGVITTHIQAAGEYAELLYCRSSLWNDENANVLQMKGREVFRIAVTKLGDVVDQTLEKANMDKSQIDWLVPHQANIRIIQAAAKRLNLPMERVILSVERHANTSAASIPLALDEAVTKGIIKRGDVLMFDAFGAGLVWGAALVKY